MLMVWMMCQPPLMCEPVIQDSQVQKPMFHMSEHVSHAMRGGEVRVDAIDALYVRGTPRR